MSPINGLILAGGQSSRMGKDKSLIEFHLKPQREYLLEVLSPYCKEVFLSCKQSDHTIPASFHTITDKYTIQSPLNGILSAFDHDSKTAWLTVPVDMPWVNSKTIGYLIAQRDAKKLATCFYDSEGKNPEPLLTIWEPGCLDSLNTFYHAGKISPRDFLKKSDVKLLTIPEQIMLTNINSEDELELFFKEKNKNPN